MQRKSAVSPGPLCVRPRTWLEDAHLADRGFWKTVDHPELGRWFVYPGEAAIFNGSPWRISCRAPLGGRAQRARSCVVSLASRAPSSPFSPSSR